MKIKDDLLQVTSGVDHADGTKGEPEEQIVRRVLLTDADATLAGNTVGEIAASVVVDSTVKDFVTAIVQNCASCKHFDHKAWKSYLARAIDPTAPMHLREGLNELRAGLMMTMNASVHAEHEDEDGMNVEEALASMGFCHVLKEIVKDDVVVHPLSTCPAESRTATNPDGYFEPRDRSAEMAGERVYDSMMRRAQGKVP
jgi:hypothetical protein